jgi:exopolysaccharide production protein ExoQ
MVSLWFAGDAPASGQSYVDGSPLDAWLFLLLTVLAFATLVARRVDVPGLLRRNVWLTLYLVYCALSITWSDFPLVSFKRYVKELGTVFVVLVVLSDKDPIATIKTVMNRCAYILVPYSVLLYKYYPGIGRGYDTWTGALIVTGVTNNKNSLGILCAACGLAVTWNVLLLVKHNTVLANKLTVMSHLVVLTTTIWLLTMANSATSNICFCVGLLLLIGTAADVIRKHIKVYAFFAALAVCGLYMALDVGSVVMGSVGRDETLTGRTELWASIINMGTNPFFGGGYGSFWLGDRLEMLWRAYWWHPTEAHNGYLETYLDLGLVGNVILLGIIMSSIGAAFRNLITKFDYGSLQLALLIVTVLYNVTESAFRPDLLMNLLFLLAAIELPVGVAVADGASGSAAAVLSQRITYQGFAGVIPGPLQHTAGSGTPSEWRPGGRRRA